MTKYLFKRIVHGLVSIVVVVALVMIMIYTMLDRNLVFAGDSKYSHTSNNARVVYKYSKWEDYGYLDYVTYADWLNGLADKGNIKCFLLLQEFPSSAKCFYIELAIMFRSISFEI